MTERNPKPFLVLLLGLGGLLLRGQDFTGPWQGMLTQEGKPSTFEYHLKLEFDGEQYSGFSQSVLADGSKGTFRLTGFWQDSTLFLQEIEQIEPPDGGWCLKQLRLQPDGHGALKGDWAAPGCTPGKVSLQRPQTATPAPPSAPPLGRWTGYLAQSDRDYGFYFELELEPDGTGSSFIDSDGPGGTARHQLSWSFDSTSNELHFRELRILEKSDPQWRWCIKNATLNWNHDSLRHRLEGDWQGFIEGYAHDPQKGACAPGTLYLEQVILPPPETAVRTAVDFSVYEQQARRVIRVGRAVEVQRPDIRIKVWDNGTVDGDELTLFLNGKKILENHRVTKHKYSIPVHLDSPYNVLILHAVDLGDIVPNTVAVSIDDGTEEQTLIISSNLHESGAILIRHFTVEGK